MKSKRIAAEIHTTVNLGNYENVRIGFREEADLEPGDDRKECKRELARRIREYIAEELENWEN